MALGGSPIRIGGSGFSSVHRLENVLMKLITEIRSFSGSSCQVGMAVKRRPRVSVR